MIIPLHTGRDAHRVATRLAIRTGEQAFRAGMGRFPEPFADPLLRGAYRDGWNRAASASINLALTGN